VYAIRGAGMGLRFKNNSGFAEGVALNLRILIADDHEVVRRGLRTVLSSRPGWIVCAEATNGREAIALATQYRPNIIVMDISMPEMNGLEATRKIRKILPKTEVLILSVHYSDQLLREIVDTGARGYVLKSDASTDLLNAVEALANRRSFFPTSAARILIDGFRNPGSATKPSILIRKTLSARQREVVQLLAEGKSSKEVAVILGISVKTADTHRAQIMRKLEIHSVIELVRYAVRNKMIEP
jgi:DNA-binding NarL/FixJ family response regulator